MISEFELGRIVGLIEADGCISIARRRQPNGYITYSTRIEIANSKKEILEHVKNQLGYGHIYLRNPAGKRGRRESWVLVIPSEMAEDFINMILPHLIIKRRQAELVLEFIKIRKSRRCWKYDHEERKRIEEIIREIRKMNRNGVHLMKVMQKSGLD
ncbi:hypothetical protein DRO31_08330 [Candidatus Bathyarchaeota archaeon]|nr:MAG: hypothetical protein DRO31_08330 [Candidatus Bathyarchaeota archaeon]